MGSKKKGIDNANRQIVERLKEIFPQYTRKELEKKVMNTPINETDISIKTDKLIDHIMNDSFMKHPKIDKNEVIAANLSPDELVLVEMFPHFKAWTLQLALSQHQNILMDCINDLMENEEQWKQVQKLSEKDSEVGGPNPWSSPAETRLCQLTQLSKSEVKSYLHKNNGNAQAALVDIVMNYDTVLQESTTTGTIPQGGRVQRGSNIKISPVKKSEVKPTSSTARYIYDSSSSEAQELQDLYYGTPKFRNNLSHTFVQRALEFCNGDASRALEMMIEGTMSDIPSTKLSETLSQDLEQITLSTEPEKEANDFSFTVVNRQSKASSMSYKLAKKRKSEAQKQLASVSSSSHQRSGVTSFYSQKAREADDDLRYALSEEQDIKVRQLLRGASATHSIDLHGLDVDHAVEATDAVLSEWWARELEGRDLQGNLRHTKGKAQHVEPYTIITGRGLHLKTGYLVIRQAVQKYLESHGYHYNEHHLRFLVNGRK